MCDEIIQKDSPFDPIQTTKTEREVVVVVVVVVEEEEEEEEDNTKRNKSKN